MFDLPVAQNSNPPQLDRKPSLRASVPASRPLAPQTPHTYLVVSGGTGCNSICAAFGHDACYVLPVSDDGGSSSEIIRVLGGPSIGAYPFSHVY